MLRLVVAGLGRNEIKRFAEATGGDRVRVTSLSDVEAARAVKLGHADYYIGACASGRGGALTMAIAILGYDKCQLVSTQGSAPSPADVKGKVRAGSHQAFGINYIHAGQVIPPLVEALLEKHGCG